MIQQLLQALHALPDWNALCAALRKNEPVGVSGAAQINRSHLIAALQEELGRRVTINRRGVGGILTVEYNSMDDLSDLVDRLTGGN